MWQNAQDAYLESRILSADPIELVRLLYHGAISDVRDARIPLLNYRLAASPSRDSPSFVFAFVSSRSGRSAAW